MGVIEIEYELNKINVFTKSDEEPTLPRNTQISKLVIIHSWLLILILLIMKFLVSTSSKQLEATNNIMLVNNVFKA